MSWVHGVQVSGCQGEWSNLPKVREASISEICVEFVLVCLGRVLVCLGYVWVCLGYVRVCLGFVLGFFRVCFGFLLFTVCFVLNICLGLFRTCLVLFRIYLGPECVTAFPPTAAGEGFGAGARCFFMQN